MQKILNLSKAEQWNYIHTKLNPADVGSRGCSSLDQLEKWISGPETLSKPTVDSENKMEHMLISPDDDKELRVEVNVYKTSLITDITGKFSLFSNWRRLVMVFVVLKRAIKNFKLKNSRVNSSSEEVPCTQKLKEESELFIIGKNQKKSFSEEITCLANGNPVHRSSCISSLNPYLDDQKLLRVGGRLGQSCLPKELTNPIILAGKSHIASLLAQHIHENCKHQGRLLTEGAVRNQGYWIVGAKRMIAKMINRCITCRKLRGKTEQQIMADLPADRLTPGPPFTFVGVDVFGPWQVVSRRTRGGMAQSKRWAVLFTCLTTRAVHIEVVEEMSSSSFINALRRFIALRGNVKEFRSDRGTNFVGAAKELKLNIVNVEDGPVRNYLCDSGVTWKFNAPHSSHMGGVWERVIGIARKILDGMLLGMTAKNITHEVLVTLMAEVCAIMNSRTIAPISNDSESPIVLTPATLLNQKIGGESSDLSMCVDIDTREMYRKHWKMVQVLADMFWKQWRDTYLQTLQCRRKWKVARPCVKTDDVVLLKDKSLSRNEWSIGVVVNAIESESDKMVRKAEVRVCKNGACTTYTRPVTEMVVLLG